jgi:hypothetical protein
VIVPEQKGRKSRREKKGHYISQKWWNFFFGSSHVLEDGLRLKNIFSMLGLVPR